MGRKVVPFVKIKPLKETLGTGTWIEIKSFVLLHVSWVCLFCLYELNSVCTEVCFFYLVFFCCCTGSSASN